MNRLLYALPLVIALLAQPARAEGETIPILLAQLAQEAKTATELGTLITVATQTMETARASTAFMAEMSSAAQGFQYLDEQDPSSWFDVASRAFFRSFPEFQAIAEDAVAIKNNLQSTINPDGYDPYALSRAIDEAINTTSSAYQTLVAVDEVAYKLTDGQLTFRRQLNEIQRNVIGIVAETQNPLGLTQKRSAALAAKAAAQNAAVNAEATKLINEQTRISKIKYLRALDASARASGSVVNQMEGFDEFFGRLGGSDLNPFEDVFHDDGVIENRQPTRSR